jgi:hypothetical protein
MEVAMDFAITMGWAGIALIVAGALVIGVGIELYSESASAFEWVATAIAALIGAVVASEFIVGLRDFGPVWDGVALVPALAGGLIVGLGTAFVMRLVGNRSYTAHGPGHA